MKLNKIYIILLLIIILNCKTIDKNSNSKNNNDEKKIEFIGTVKKIIAGPKGTFSQYSYFVLDPDNKSDSLIKNNFANILFNKDTKDSRGFDEYIDKKVKITGKETIGYIGWKKEAKPGILVEEIKIIN